MITELSEEQIAELANYRDKWIEIGLNTDPMDADRAMNKAVKQIYEQAGLECPDKHEVCSSPFAAVKMMKEKYDVDVKVQDFAFGLHEAPLLSFYEVFLDMFQIEECKPIIPMMELAKCCGWVLFYDELVVLTDKPCAVHFDAENRTHCEDDFAIKYRDGTGVTVWHGQRVPEEWIFDKSSITPEVVTKWENIEERRCACEILGWAQVMEICNASVIDEDDDPTIGTLVLVDLPDVGEEKFLVALDPNTEKKIGLPVPETVNTAREANAWTYSISADDFKPDFRV